MDPSEKDKESGMRRREDRINSDREDFLDYHSEETFEPMRKSERGSFPTSNERKARRSSKETYASKKVRKSVSKDGGMHRRRRKKV